MGFMKSFIGQEHLLMTENVCHKCFENDDLKSFIKKYGKSKSCDYCHSKVKSHNIGEVVEYIHNCLLREYEDPNDCMGWDGREGGFQGASTYDSHEVLYEAGLETNSDEVFDAIAYNLPIELWCQRDPYVLSDRDEMVHTWEEFSKLVKYKCRYMFLEHETREQEKSLDRILISKILHRLAHSFKTIGLFTTIKKGTILYRARYYGDKYTFELTKEELGPPPIGVPKSSRMSPAGIPMFYATKEESTALDEISIEKGSQYAFATFVLKEDLTLIDFTKIPPLPSIFSENKADLRDDIYFLKKFLADFTKKIEKDGREHVEYVPTQIVSEFCKYNVTYKNQPIKGFIYPSAVTRGGTSYCLFLERKDFGIHDSTFFREQPTLVECQSVTLKTR